MFFDIRSFQTNLDRITCYASVLLSKASCVHRFCFCLSFFRGRSTNSFRCCFASVCFCSGVGGGASVFYSYYYLYWALCVRVFSFHVFWGRSAYFIGYLLYRVFYFGYIIELIFCVGCGLLLTGLLFSSLFYHTQCFKYYWYSFDLHESFNFEIFVLWHFLHFFLDNILVRRDISNKRCLFLPIFDYYVGMNRFDFFVRSNKQTYLKRLGSGYSSCTLFGICLYHFLLVLML